MYKNNKTKLTYLKYDLMWTNKICLSHKLWNKTSNNLYIPSNY